MECQCNANNPPPIKITLVEYQEFVCQLVIGKQIIIETNIETYRAEDWENSFSLGEENIPPVKLGNYLFEHPMNGEFYKVVTNNSQRYVLLILNHIAPQLVKKLTAYSRTVRN